MQSRNKCAGAGGVRCGGAVPRVAPALVGGVVRTARGNFDVVVRQDKLADRHVKSESVDGAVDRKHEYGGGAVHAVPRRD